MAMLTPIAAGADPAVFTVPAKAPLGFQVSADKLPGLFRYAADALPTPCPDWADSKHSTQFLLGGKAIGRMQRVKIVEAITALSGIPAATINSVITDVVPDTGQSLATLKRVVRLLTFTITRDAPPPGMPADTVVLAAPPTQQLAPLEAELIAAKTAQAHLAAALAALPGSADLQAKATAQATVVAAAAAAVEVTRQRIADAAADAAAAAAATTTTAAAAATNTAAAAATNTAAVGSPQQQAAVAAATLEAANTALASMQRALELIPGSAEVQAEVTRLQAVASAADARSRALHLAASINAEVQLVTNAAATIDAAASNGDADQIQVQFADDPSASAHGRVAILRRHGVGRSVKRLAAALQGYYDVIDAGLQPAVGSPVLAELEQYLTASRAVQSANRELRAAGYSPYSMPASVAEAQEALDSSQSSNGRHVDHGQSNASEGLTYASHQRGGYANPGGNIRYGASQANAGQGLTFAGHQYNGGYAGTTPAGIIRQGAGNPWANTPYGATQTAGNFHPSVFGQPPASQRPAIPVHGPAHSGIGGSRLAAVDQVTIQKGEYLDYAAAAHRMFYAGTPPKPAMRLVNDGSGTAIYEAVDPDQQFAAISDTVYHQVHRAEMAFRTALAPDRGPEHEEHTRHLDDLKIRFTSSLPAGWRAYDKVFRQHAAGTQQRYEVVTTSSGITAQVPSRVNWGSIDDRVHRNVFFGYKPGLCGLCGGSHFVEDHARAVKPAAKKRPQPASQAGAVCKAYNRESDRSKDKGCTFKDCKFKHVCRKCNGDHAATECTVKKAK